MRGTQLISGAAKRSRSFNCPVPRPAQEQGIVPRQQTVELCCETRDFCHCGPFRRKRNGEALEINRNAVPQVVCESPSRSFARPSLCLTVTQALSQ